MAAAGMTERQCANVLDISMTEFKAWYEREYAVGHDRATAMVSANLLRVATDPDHRKCVEAGMYWLNSRAGWKQTSKVELEGKIAAAEDTRKQIIDAIVEQLVPAAKERAEAKH
jgi:hypothetical protein